MRTWRWLIFTACASSLASCGSIYSADESRSQYMDAVKAFAVHHFQHAEQHLKDSIRLASASPTKPALHGQLADRLLFLAQVQSEEGKYSSAERSLKQAVDVLASAYGAESRQVAAALQQLAVCHYFQGEYDEASAAAQRALDIERVAVPKNDLLVAATDNNLAEAYEKLEKAPQAEQLFNQALAIYGAHKSEDRGRQGLVETLNNLALFYRHENRLLEARQTVDKALELSGLPPGGIDQSDPASGLLPVVDNLSRTNNRNARNGASALNTRASVERAEFNYDAAGDDYRCAIALVSDGAPRHQELLCQITDNFADMLLDQKDYAAAEKLYKVAIEQCRRAHGNMHPLVAERMNDLADVYRHEQRYAEAQPLLEQVMTIDRIAFESDSPITLASMNSLSSVYLSLKKPDQAEKVYADWLPVLTKVLGPDHPHVADALDNWALVAQKSGDQKQAAALRLRAKKIRVKSEQPPDKSAAQP